MIFLGMNMKEYKVLSGKYRPKKLNDVIGQGFAVKTLENAFLQKYYFRQKDFFTGKMKKRQIERGYP